MLTYLSSLVVVNPSGVDNRRQPSIFTDQSIASQSVGPAEANSQPASQSVSGAAESAVLPDDDGDDDSGSSNSNNNDVLDDCGNSVVDVVVVALAYVGSSEFD